MPRSLMADGRPGGGFCVASPGSGQGEGRPGHGSGFDAILLLRWRVFPSLRRVSVCLRWRLSGSYMEDHRDTRQEMVNRPREWKWREVFCRKKCSVKDYERRKLFSFSICIDKGRDLRSRQRKGGLEKSYQRLEMVWKLRVF